MRNYDNTNKLLAQMPGCNGMKTGYTSAAGRCLVSSASRSGRDVMGNAVFEGAKICSVLL